jgi:acetyl-CoA carboxylase biotin carboxyl carrier protein
MNQEELKELIYYLSQKDISEFSIERADLAVRIKRRVEIPNEAGASLLSALVSNGAMGSVADGVLSRPNGTNGSTTAAQEEKPQILKSPLVGIFHNSRSPHDPPFLRKGDTVEVGQIVGMVEMLRLMHEIHSDVAGEVLEIIASDQKPVEYGQALLAVRPEKKAI